MTTQSRWLHSDDAATIKISVCRPRMNYKSRRQCHRERRKNLLPQGSIRVAVAMLEAGLRRKLLALPLPITSPATGKGRNTNSGHLVYVRPEGYQIIQTSASPVAFTVRS